MYSDLTIVHVGDAATDWSCNPCQRHRIFNFPFSVAMDSCLYVSVLLHIDRHHILFQLSSTNTPSLTPSQKHNSNITRITSTTPNPSKAKSKTHPTNLPHQPLPLHFEIAPLHIHVVHAIIRRRRAMSGCRGRCGARHCFWRVLLWLRVERRVCVIRCGVCGDGVEVE